LDVFAWRGSPAAWNEYIEPIVGASMRAATQEEQHRLHRLGDRPVVAGLNTGQGQILQVAAAAEHRSDLAGPFGATSATG
jgi:hypothetical protein